MANQYALDVVCSARWSLEGTNNVRITSAKGIRAVDVNGAELNFFVDTAVTFLELGQLVFAQQDGSGEAGVQLIGEIVSGPQGLQVRVTPTTGPESEPTGGQFVVFPVQGQTDILGRLVTEGEEPAPEGEGQALSLRGMTALPQLMAGDGGLTEALFHQRRTDPYEPVGDERPDEEDHETPSMSEGEDNHETPGEGEESTTTT